MPDWIPELEAREAVAYAIMVTAVMGAVAFGIAHHARRKVQRLRLKGDGAIKRAQDRR